MNFINHYCTGKNYSVTKSFLLDGVDEYFIDTTSALWDVVKGFNSYSIVIWVKLAVTNSNETFFGFGDTDGSDFIYIGSLSDNTIWSYTYSGGVKQWDYRSTPTVGTGWKLIGITNDGAGNIVLYKNGSSVSGSFEAGGSDHNFVFSDFGVGIDNCTIGGRSKNSEGLTIEMSGNWMEAGVYNGVLSASVMTEIYNSGAVKALTSMSVQPDLYFNAQNSVFSTNHVITEVKTSNTITSVAMEEADLESDIPT